MPVKKRTPEKKRVKFSDDTTITSQHKEKQQDYDRPPIFVRKTLLTVPWHLLILLFYYVKLSDNYDTFKLLLALIPSQMLYLTLQFNKCIIYGKKRLKTNKTLLLIALGGSIALSIPVMIILVLFGAPLVEYHWLTWLLSMHACFLAYPAIYHVFNCDFKVGMWKKYIISIAIGGWVSCVVIPLDWDRDWQAWPVPVVVGMYLGAFIGYSIVAYI